MPPAAAMIDSDRWRSASHRNMIENLVGPFGGGAVEGPVQIDDHAQAPVDRPMREPLFVCAPRTQLGSTGLRVEATVHRGGTTEELDALTFAPSTEAGAFLALHLPQQGGDGVADPCALALRVIEVAADASEQQVPAKDVRERVQLRLIEGVMGRVAYLLGAEKQRLRREGRVLADARHLSSTRDGALDAVGADLGVPRLLTDLVVQNGAISTAERREPDGEYRRRLAIYRPWSAPNRRAVAERLNGPGESPAPNAGPLAEMGLEQRFSLRERGNELAMAVLLVASEDPSHRETFLAHLRAVHLIWPKLNPPANLAHSRRFLSTAQRARQGLLRSELRRLFDLDVPGDANPAVAAGLAADLVLAARCREALSAQQPPAIWPLRRAQDGTGGSRYELGLGADVEPLSAQELNALGARLKDPTRPPAADREVESLLSSMKPLPAGEDPDGRWLLEPCGLRTVHPVENGMAFVSHLPFFGVVLSGASLATTVQPAELAARYNARGDPGDNVVLARGLEGALVAWAAAGGPAFTVLDEAAAMLLWDAAQSPPQPAIQVFREARLTARPDPAPVVAQLKNVPGELVATLLLAPAQSQAIIGGQAGAATALARLRDLLREQWIHSALPLVVGPQDVALVVGVTRLTDAGIRLSRRRVTGVRWYAEPIVGDGGMVDELGPRASFEPSGPGLTAVVALGYARRELTDPYEYEVGLPAAARLEVKQYEFLMNLLEHTHPMGLGVNTARIRERNLDLSGDGVADPLTASQSRMYREFRPGRRGGAGTVFAPDVPGFQLGVHSTVGIDTLLKSRPANP